MIEITHITPCRKRCGVFLCFLCRVFGDGSPAYVCWKLCEGFWWLKWLMNGKKNLSLRRKTVYAMNRAPLLAGLPVATWLRVLKHEKIQINNIWYHLEFLVLTMPWWPLWRSWRVLPLWLWRCGLPGWFPPARSIPRKGKHMSAVSRPEVSQWHVSM